ncbi:hypothetical protein GCM10010912_68370 [Paenibacillus albidus]|uniref:Uncharacterized protein n=1 Tax=Paenibacillus albidus TaxID=2041023 RepID=A0A917LCX9_9BACL|nr:hypothetical protein GCM10010912_68370 [Paenibacillus albidus]
MRTWTGMILLFFAIDCKVITLRGTTSKTRIYNAKGIYNSKTADFHHDKGVIGFIAIFGSMVVMILMW